MTINFPSSPAFGDQFSVDTKTWEWNGVIWKNVSTGSGGGGPGASVEPSIDEYYDFASVYGVDQGYDYEFNETTTSLPSGWTWVNQGSSTYEEGFGYGVMVPEIAGSLYDWRILVQSLPVGDWTAWASVTGESLLGDYSPGLVFRNSSTGAFAQIMVNYNSSSTEWYFATWSDENTYIGSVGNGTVRGTQVKYIKVETIGSDMNIYFSADGIGWIKAISTWTMTITFDQIGFGATNSHFTERTYVGLRWLRIRT